MVISISSELDSIRPACPRHSVKAVGLVPSSLTAAQLAAAFDPATDLGDLTGTVSLVTGGNIGIGYYSALALARKGAHVVIACRSQVALCVFGRIRSDVFT